MSTAVLEVLEGGLLTTVQDGGRTDAVHLGVPVGGACDPWSLAMANALVGNEPAAAALEMTLAGPTLRARRECAVALAGADMEGRRGDGRRISPGAVCRLGTGETLAFGAAAEGTGARAYLALEGGFDVPLVLGSRSTCLVGGFGGFEGRALRSGDLLRPASAQPPVSVDRAYEQLTEAPAPLRVVAGPDAARLRDALEGLVSGPHAVSGRSDRQGLRLDGPALPIAAGLAGGLSHGVVWGSIQLPPDGRPICLLADHQTVGGYPVIAVVIRADLPRLGQLAPADPVAFRLVDLAEAQAAARERAAQEARLLAWLGNG